MTRIPFTVPFQAPNTLHYIEQSLASGHLSGDGPFTRRASTLLHHILDQRPARTLLTTSCTHALEMCALLLDLQPGDEVILPSYTFSSTANAFKLRGVTLRFADIDLHTFSMGPEHVAPLLTEKTRAVIAVHYGGVAHDIDQLRDLCKDRAIALVEDNAHGLFATFRGQPLGTFGDLATLSFHATKNISCGEGGALIAMQPEPARRAEIIREKGTDRSLFMRGEVDKYTWRETGSSYLPSDILAAVLTAQLEAAETIQNHRQRVWSTYRERLEPHQDRLQISLQTIPPHVQHPAHVFALLVPESIGRGPILNALKTAGIRATSHYEPLHKAPAHTGQESLPNTDQLARRLIRLPLFADLSTASAATIADTLIQTLETLLP